jgi:hypothetical protein
MGWSRIARRVAPAVAAAAVLHALFAVVTVYVGLRVAGGVLRTLIGPETFGESVAVILRDGDADTKVQMLELLGTMGEEARQFVPPIVAALEDTDARVRKAAEDALRKIDPDALQDTADHP